MRLWHKDLIHVLPDKQLISQWCECCAIAGNIKNKGIPNHILVNKIMHYNLSHFYKYCQLVVDEMYHRSLNVSPRSIEKIQNITDCDIRMGSEFVTYDELFSGWHNDRYLKQCYYNLQEKYDCKGIQETDWKAIEKQVKNNLQ